MRTVLNVRHQLVCLCQLMLRPLFAPVVRNEQCPNLLVPLSQLRVDARWQRAVETVLDNYLQAVCVDDLATLGRRLDDLAGGRLALVESGDAAAPDGTLAAQVVCGGRVAGLLAGIRTADDAEAAFGLRAALAAHESVITPDGLWLGPNWLYLQRGEAGAGGALRRREELESLGAEIEELAQRAAALETAQTACTQRLRELEGERQAAQRALQAATRDHAALSARLEAQQARVEQLEARRQALARDKAEAESQFESEQAALAGARQTLASAIERMETDAGEREALLSRRDELRGSLDGARQAARQSRDAAHQAAMQQRALQTQSETLRGSLERTRGQVGQLEDRRQALRDGLADADAPLAALEDELAAQLALRAEAERALASARQQVADVEHRLRSDEQARAAVEERARGARSELEACRLTQQAQQVERDGLDRRLQELSGDREQLLAELPQDATRAAWTQELERVAARIARLGPINLAAIDEFGQQSERKQYLDAQHEDLESALATLESAIRKIDRETRSRFQATFDKVNSGLQDLFPRVFGGGSACLEMTGDDLLDTGISIMARPPGKKNSTIHLLSGGEKALTAIALVFAIFQLNPAPFCMLDEVDAPLDDANVGRYARMVREMSERVQFIFITHNKITMEMADQLLGVTMHEPGVSRLVAVDVDEAAELAAS